MPQALAIISEKEPDFTSLLERGNFITRFAGGDSRNRCVTQLHALLEKLSPEAAFAAQAEWLEDVVGWLFERGHPPGRLPREHEATARLRLLLDVLDEIPERKTALRALVVEAFTHLDPVHLFTDTGVPSQASIFTEAWERATRSVLPEPPVENDAGRMLFRLFPDARSAAWFDGLSPELLHRLFTTLAVPTAHALAPMWQAMRDAALVLAVRISAAGTDEELRERTTATVHDSPFLKLPLQVRQLITEEKPDPEKNTACRECLAACRKEKARVIASLDATGISLHLVYRLDYIRTLLDRLYILLAIIAPPAGQVAEGQAFRLVQLLIRGGVRDRSLYELFGRNSRLLARRIIERAGSTGEHYISRTRAEWHQMVSSASGGGFVTGFAVLFKFLIGWAKLPVLFEGLALGSNYALSFMLMQLCGFTLATKQPSMTAATLAGSIKETEAAADLTLLVDQVVRTVRSQLAAAIGNVGMVIPTALGLDLLVKLLTGHHFLTAEYAEKVIRIHHPVTSLTVLWAALTGCFLWAASVAGGAIENWFVVTKLPHSIASIRWLRGLIGAHRAQSAARSFSSHIAGLSVGLILGFELALVPMLFSMIGIGIEVRHVTFVTGQLVYAGMTRGAFGVLHPDYLFALCSIGVVGALNFGVSFSLALAVAFRARDVRAAEQVRLLFAVGKRFRQRPLDFFRAPKDA
ncbi:MAG: gliding motility protein [Archangiaceae bacterium]|nr:gliding motility protein [Archangiaceae bacterium]